MRRGRQLSLFGMGDGEGYLFDPKHFQHYLASHDQTLVPKEEERAARLQAWVESLQTTKATETALEGKFIAEIFGFVLGYRSYPNAPGEIATVFAKPNASFTRLASGTPDAVLGEFADDDARFTAVVELKTPGTNLDMPQPGYNSETPVEQGFRYATQILGAKWVIVSDMLRLRLYSVESMAEHEELTLADCVKDGKPTAAFRRLHFLFHHDFLIAGHESSQVSLLYGKTADRQLEIRDSFYGAYYLIRNDLFRALEKSCKLAGFKATRENLLEATQRLLDRLLFIFYCEDNPQQLIPRGTLKRVTEAAATLPGPSAHKVYTHLKSLFREIDVGSTAESGVEVTGYNGELFKDHWILDHIELPDTLNRRDYSVLDADGSTRRIVVHN